MYKEFIKKEYERVFGNKNPKYKIDSIFMSNYKDGRLCSRVVIDDIFDGKYYGHTQWGNKYETTFEKFEDFYKDYKKVGIKTFKYGLSTQK